MTVITNTYRKLYFQLANSKVSFITSQNSLASVHTGRKIHS